MTKSDQIRAALLARYPCARIPYGHEAALAVEFGCTRQLVQNVMHKLGKRASMLKAWPIVLCAVCRQPMPRKFKSATHRACLYVEFPCEQCGRPVRRLASQLAWNVGCLTGTKYTGRVFCSRSCWAHWTGPRHGRAFRESQAATG